MDETFIIMCREAKEIQEQWEPKGTDLVREYIPTPEWPVEDLSGFEWWGDRDQEVVKDECFWLPRQEDLQTIFMDWNTENGEHPNIKATSYWKMYCCFTRYMDSFADTKLNWNKWWLCFVMETCYNKTWNGKSWTRMEE